jgi:hypothetical protein
MECDSEAKLGRLTNWRGIFARQLSFAQKLLTVGSTVPLLDRMPSVADVRALALPHMAILLHKRAKASASATILSDTRWLEELNRCADRWPHLAPDAAARTRLIEMLDRIVEQEQRQMDVQLSAIPVTSRFDSSWAI